jgi:hypothetical protein
MAVWEGVAGVTAPRPAPRPEMERPRVAPVEPLPDELLAAEWSFYGGYGWCLDAFPRVDQVVVRLDLEMARLDEPHAGWQREEMAVNVFLLAAALIDAVDDYRAGESYDFRKAESMLPLAAPLTRAVQWALRLRARRRDRRHRSLHDWRAAFGAALEGFVLAALVAPAAVAAAPPRPHRRPLLRGARAAPRLGRRR